MECYRKKLKFLSDKLGIKKGKLSTHGLRRGSVALGHLNGISESLLKVYGDWSSDCFKRYLQFPLAMRIEASRKMVERLQKLN